MNKFINIRTVLLPSSTPHANTWKRLFMVLIDQAKRILLFGKQLRRLDKVMSKDQTILPLFSLFFDYLSLSIIGKENCNDKLI